MVRRTKMLKTVNRNMVKVLVISVNGVDSVDSIKPPVL
jgi:hypothetical protein